MKEYIFDVNYYVSVDKNGYYCDSYGKTITGLLIRLIDEQKYFYYVKDGKYHNLNGPAIIQASGHLDYYIDDVFVGVNLSNQQFKEIVKKYIFK